MSLNPFLSAILKPEHHAGLVFYTISLADICPLCELFVVLEVSKLKAHTAIVPNSPGQHPVPHLKGSSPIDGFESANVHIAFRILGM